MIVLIRADPSLLSQLADQGLGDPPNLGDVRPHRSQSGRFQPPGGQPQYAALWELESEHVIPQSYANALFSAFHASSTSSGEYGAMHTILIYKGAADVKTESAGGDNTVYRTLQETGAELRQVVDETTDTRRRARTFDDVKPAVLRLFEAYSANALDRTYEAVLAEHGAANGTSTNGEIRKRPPGPAASRIREAFRLQSEDVTSMLGSRLT
jgi:hypothetical protein